MFRSSAPQHGGFSIIELIVVVSIIAILSSIAIPSYIKYTQKANVTSYVLPLVRACMSDIASYCSVDSPQTGTEEYTNPVGDSRFPNCRDNILTPAGIVRMEFLESPKCSNNGILLQGRLVGYFSGSSGGYRANCQVDVRPFRCYIE